MQTNKIKMTRIEQNIMIAKFMGYEYFPFIESERQNANGIPIDQMNGWHKPTNGHYKINNWYLCRTHRDLAYHCKWDWLMPVCRQICKTTPFNSELKIETMSVFAEIEDVYSAVVEFIEWYNNRDFKP